MGHLSICTTGEGSTCVWPIFPRENRFWGRWHGHRFHRDMKKHFTFIMVAVAGLMAPVAFVGCATSHDSDSHKRTAGQYIDDRVLQAKVHSALGDNDVYKFPDVKANTYKGTV